MVPGLVARFTSKKFLFNPSSDTATEGLVGVVVEVLELQPMEINVITNKTSVISFETKCVKFCHFNILLQNKKKCFIFIDVLTAID